MNERKRLLRWGSVVVGVVMVAGGCGGDEHSTSVTSPASQTAGPEAMMPAAPAPAAPPQPTAAERRAPLRLLSPLSGSFGSSRQPILRWTPAERATVEVCADRACGRVLAAISGKGEARPGAPLPAGVIFWRVVSQRASTPVWELVIPARDGGTSIAWGVTSDFNADGRADITIGAPTAGGGTVSIFYGASIGPGHTPDIVLSGNPGFGRAVAAIGDVNGDGYGDLAVAADSNPGTVSIFYGGSSGLAAGPSLYAGQVTRFGASMASAGDANGDGYGDLVVGGAEAAQVFLGSADGLNVEATFTLAGSMDPEFSGDAGVVQGPADINADGRPDLFVGGAVYLGNGAGFAPQPGFASGRFGSFVGDHNGDGFVDFGDYEVLPGVPTGVAEMEYLFVQAGEYVFASAGDFDGDGYSDVLSSVSSVVEVPERERLYFGAPGACGSTGCRRFVPLFIPGRTHESTDVTFIASVGDIDGDGATDLVVTTPDAGKAYLYRGGSDRLPLRFPFPTWSGAVGFGSSIPSLFGTARPAL